MTNQSMTLAFFKTSSLPITRHLFNLLLPTCAVVGLMLSLQAIAQPAPLQHQMTIEGETIDYDAPPRLSDAVMDGLRLTEKNIVDIYWPGAGLYDITLPSRLSPTAMAAAENQITIQTGKPQQRWRRLVRTLKTFTVERRAKVSLDPDLTRIDISKNPRLDGQWRLVFPQRPDHVWVLGNVAAPGQYSWQVRQGASDYLGQAKANTLGKSYAWVVQPDGAIEKHAIAYWNASHQDIAPGAVIYLPLPVKGLTSYPDTIDANQLVLDYLSNRLPE
ncbi:hypothetical protein BZG18_13810 [Salinivibrio kushneri]|nr:hypothetical protein BZG18_13810 [Salinivibrio kushneri]